MFLYSNSLERFDTVANPGGLFWIIGLTVACVKSFGCVQSQMIKYPGGEERNGTW